MKPHLNHLKPTPYIQLQWWFDSKCDDREVAHAIYASMIDIDTRLADYWHFHDHDSGEGCIVALPLAGCHRAIIRTALRELYCKARPEFFHQIHQVGGTILQLTDIGEEIQTIPTHDRDRFYWKIYTWPDGSTRLSPRLILCKKSKLFERSDKGEVLKWNYRGLISGKHSLS